MNEISVVVPLLNEEDIIEELTNRLNKEVSSITNEYEIILVDDGSTDQTWREIIQVTEKNKKIKALKFSRNFGHHYAITAGIHQTKGEWIVVMDGDLQDKPEVIPSLYKEAKRGFEVVFVSRNNRPESILYKITQKVFYRVLNLLTGLKFDSTQANFSIINRKVADAFKQFSENSRFYGSTIKWLGFNTTSIKADHGYRFAGKPSYTFKKRFKLAEDIIVSFSDRPLRFSFTCIFLNFINFIFLFYLFKNNMLNLEILLIVLITGFLTSLFLILGIIGIYVGKIFTQIKNRPLYVISEIVNC